MAWRPIRAEGAISLFDGLRSARPGSQKPQYVFHRHARRQSLLRPIENVQNPVTQTIDFRQFFSSCVAPDYHRVAQIVNQTVYYGIWLTAFICIVQLAKDIRRLALQRT
jgi:hypothetical protein